jgi:hypothetical protein
VRLFLVPDRLQPEAGTLAVAGDGLPIVVAEDGERALREGNL